MSDLAIIMMRLGCGLSDWSQIGLCDIASLVTGRFYDLEHSLQLLRKSFSLIPITMFRHSIFMYSLQQSLLRQQL